MAVVLGQLVFIFQRSTFQNGSFAFNVDLPAMTSVNNATGLDGVAPTQGVAA